MKFNYMKVKVKFSAMKVHNGVEVKLHAFLT
jgi:hypothetical protein